MKDSISILRFAAIIEGLSLLILLFIAMPLKYYHGNAEVVPVVGMTHGILFLIFFALSVFVSQRKAWSDSFWAMLVLSSMIPFATFLMDRKLKTLN
jgi:integral membrane protein